MTELTTHNPTPDRPGPDGKPGGAWIWPSIVLGLLAMQAVICFAAVFVATSDPSHAVVSDYHAKAVAWDQQMDERRAGETLGWQSQLDIALKADMLGDRITRLSLQDAQGGPLTGAAVTVSAFHHARANQVVEAELNETAPGEYLAQMKMRKAGLWELAFVVSRGEDVYRFSIKQQVGQAGGAPK